MAVSSSSGPRTGSHRIRAIAVVFTAVLCGPVAPAAADSDSGQSRDRGVGTGAKPTVVLVHGAFADSSSWNGVVERLQRAGYPVRAAANPLRGLTSDSAYVASLLKTIKGPIVLAGHSYGGAVISSAAAGNPQVTSLVYVSSLVPDVGESVNSLTAKFPPSEVNSAVTMVPFSAGGGVRGTDVYLKPDRLHQVFAADLPVRTAALLAATQRPAAAATFSETARAAAWRTVPSWTLVARQDKAVNPDLERFQAKRARSHTVEIDSSHLAMISHPGEVTDLILRAAGASPSPRTSLAQTGAKAVPVLVGLGGVAGAAVLAGVGALAVARKRGRSPE